MKTPKQLLIDEEWNFLKAAPVLHKNFYMGNVLCSASTLEEAEKLQQQLIAIMQKVEMELHK